MAASDFRATLAKAQLEEARASADAYTKALEEAKAAEAALKGPPTPTQAAAAEVQRIAAEAKKAEAAYNALAKAQAKALNSFSSGAPGGTTSPWAAKPGSTKPSAPAVRAAASAKKDASGPGGLGGNGVIDASGINLPKGLRYALKQAGVSKAAMRAPVVAGAMDLAKLAMGQRGMMMLSALTARAEMQGRQLFKGVDSSPVTRAYDKFLQVVNPMSASGKVLQSVFSRMFNGFFGSVERAQPYVSAFVQGAIGGALDIEYAWLSLRLALLPATTALENVIGPLASIDGMADAGEAAFIALGAAALFAAAPIVAIGAAVMAVTKAFEQLAKLKKELEGGGGTQASVVDMVNHFGGSDSEDEIGKRARAAFERSEAQRKATPPAIPTADTGKAGADTGTAVWTGMVDGMNAGMGPVEAAGKRLGAQAVAGARAGADAHSPSRATHRLGLDMDEGAAQGMEAGRGGVEAKAREVFAPPGMTANATAQTATGSASAFPPEMLALMREMVAMMRGMGKRGGGGGSDPFRGIALELGVDLGAA